MNDTKRRLNTLAHRLGRRLPVPVKVGFAEAAPPSREPTEGREWPRTLSVVVVGHNAEAYLSECLESLRSQTLKRIEVLVVDDGSTDGTVDIARKIAAEDPRFQLLIRPQVGLDCMPAMTGVQVARGEFLAFRGRDRHRATPMLMPAWSARCDVRVQILRSAACGPSSEGKIRRPAVDCHHR